MKRTRLNRMVAGLLGWAVACALAPGAGAQVTTNRPAIRDVRQDSEGRMVLTIRPAGVTNEVIDVFASDRLVPAAWRLAQPYLRVNGRTEIVWTDPAAPGAAERFYQVARADLDADENGIADAREHLFHVHDLPSGTRARWAAAGRKPPLPSYANVLNVRTYGAKGDGVTDDATVIGNVISQAPAGSVIYLPAGTYRLTKALMLKSDMVLRGDGPELTSLLFSGSGTAGRCIGLVRWDSDQTTTYVTPTAGLEAGSTTVTVSSVTGFVPGNIIEIEEQNDPAWNLTEAWEAYLPGQMNRVTAVDTAGKRLVLQRPLRHTFTAARGPRLRRLTTISNAGVENLYVRRMDAVDGHTIEMKYAVGCWVRRVESYKTYKGHVWLERGYECEVRQSYFHDSFVFAGGQGYGVACAKRTSDCLVEDNIFQHLRHSLSVGIGANGNVYGYNYSTTRALDPSLGTPQADLSVHGCYVFMNLFEGNVLEDADVPDWYWPAGPGNTLFRNRIINSGTAIDVSSPCQNFMGNVLPNGAMAVSGEAQLMVDFGNECRGTATWPGCPCRSLPDSLYRSVPPDFFPETGPWLWPPIGPDVAVRDGALIPAQYRYATGAYVP